jgi:hypothetical protein
MKAICDCGPGYKNQREQTGHVKFWFSLFYFLCKSLMAKFNPMGDP